MYQMCAHVTDCLISSWRHTTYTCIDVYTMSIVLERYMLNSPQTLFRLEMTQQKNKIIKFLQLKFHHSSSISLIPTWTTPGRRFTRLESLSSSQYTPLAICQTSKLSPNNAGQQQMVIRTRNSCSSITGTNIFPSQQAHDVVLTFWRWYNFVWTSTTLLQRWNNVLCLLGYDCLSRIA